MPGWDYHNGGYGWTSGLLMIITMVIFWGGLITVAVLLIRRLGVHSGTGQGGAQRILDERFARGEIDQDEYDSRSQTLRSSS